VILSTEKLVISTITSTGFHQDVQLKNFKLSSYIVIPNV